MSQYQWAKNYNLDLYEMKEQQTTSSGGGGGGGRRGGGGGRRSYGGGGSYSAGSSSNTNLDNLINEANNKANPTYHPNSNLYYQGSGGTKNAPSKSPSSMTYSQTYNRDVLKKKK